LSNVLILDAENATKCQKRKIEAEEIGIDSENINVSAENTKINSTSFEIDGKL
jgi:hypothetical protein